MKINFEIPTQYGVFRDALYLSDDHGLSDQEIEALKQARVDNWIYCVENPPAEEPVAETIELDGIVYEKIEIDGQIVLKPIKA